MKNSLEISIIEDGRIDKAQKYGMFCFPAYQVACANYTNCIPNQYGKLDWDGQFIQFCGVVNGKSYSVCSWGGNSKPFSVNSCNIANNYNVCKDKISYSI